MIFLFLWKNVLIGQTQEFKFERFSTDQGLSSSTVVDIYQDSEGYLWFGTIDGLNRFDGYNFEVFRTHLGDKNSISDNRITSISGDHLGNLWIGTIHGLNFYVKESHQFYEITLSSSENHPGGILINDVLFDSTQTVIWVATVNGVYAFSEIQIVNNELTYSKKEFLKGQNVQRLEFNGYNQEVITITQDRQLYGLKNDEARELSLNLSAGDFVTLNHLPAEILFTSKNEIWIGNDLSNILIYNVASQNSRIFSPVDPSIPIFDMYQDLSGRIWISTDGYGLYLFDRETQLIDHILHQEANKFSIPNNQPSKVLEDKDGIYWIASYNEGVSRINPDYNTFGHFYYQANKSEGLSTKIAQAVLEDDQGRLWIGTDGGGLNYFDQKNNRFIHYRHDPNDPNSLSSDKIVYLKNARDGNIWVCTWDGGLNKFLPEQKIFEKVAKDSLSKYDLKQNTIWVVEEDENNRLWIGSQKTGLILLDLKTSKVKSYRWSPENRKSILSDFIFSLKIDSKNRLFVGTDSGLNVIDLSGLNHHQPDQIDFSEVHVAGISGQRINFIFEHDSGDLWIGSDLGLFQLDSNLQLKKHYNTENGLTNDLVVGITADLSGNLWVTTKGGMSRIDLSKGIVTNFSELDGIQGREFQSKSIELTRDGRILVGGINGFNLFNPQEIEIPNTELKTKITNLYLFNNVVHLGDTVNNRVIFQKPLEDLEELKLKYNENYISLDFLSLYLQNPERISYRFRLEGLEKAFIHGVSGQRRVNYYGLRPGDYRFEVQSALDGNWENAQTTGLNISISSPPWFSWWAYCIYTLAIGSLIFVVGYYYTLFHRRNREREIDHQKMQFFINLSHEFRTPLTLIVNPIENILRELDNKEIVKKYALAAKKSSRRLLNLVNQLLDYSRVESGNVKLRLTKMDVVGLLKDKIEPFIDLAESKGITFVTNFEKDEIIGNFDRDKIEIIISNLLSNAVKFTDENGKIHVRVGEQYIREDREETNFLMIEISDSGIGFKPEQMEQIFTRFFQADEGKAGTGIGLNFTKSLVELHEGVIYVHSNFGQGSVFTVKIPGNLPLPQSDDYYLKQNDESFEFNSFDATAYDVNQESEIEVQNPIVQSKVNILIVEDNDRLRKHLKEELRNFFNITIAKNGQEGLEKVMTTYPDLVISDVVMPKMNGFEMCKAIKSNFDTLHIPVILLTARTTDDDRIEGFNIGADAYLPKPFYLNVLLAQVNNLLERKRRLREKFLKLETNLVPENESHLKSADEVFLDKATKLVIENLSKSELSIDELARMLNMGRSQLFRKVTQITGDNPSKFVRNIKLKYAAELLLQNRMSIKEISFEVGFNSPAYFSKTFKDLYQLTPSQYQEQFAE